MAFPNLLYLGQPGKDKIIMMIMFSVSCTHFVASVCVPCGQFDLRLV